MKALCILLTCFLLSPAFGNAQTSSQRSGNEDFKRQFLDAINAKRAAGCNCGSTYMEPAPPLSWNNDLAVAAYEHAGDMYSNKYFSHDSKDGRSLQDRLFNVGYNYKGYRSYAIGENIAFGQQSISEVLSGWFASKGHCKNLMNPMFREIGIAEKNHYWVQDFGGRTRFDSR